MDWWERADGVIERMEQILLVVLLSSMILIAFLQIMLRNLFSTGLSWGDPLVRNLVLWVGFIGATLATREGKHINIDLISIWLPPKKKHFVSFFTDLFSFTICLLLTYAALKFIKNETEMGNITFLNIPVWIPGMILPITFGLMTFRFGLRFLKNLFSMGTDAPFRDRERTP
ncbi:MAG: TRAP transporter small permease [Thermodesulfobacteriota bacterium]